MQNLRTCAVALLMCTMGFSSHAAFSDDYPHKPIRMVTNPAGGGTDYVARIVAQGLTASLGQQVVVDNRPAVFNGVWLPTAPPDGYSIYMGGEALWMIPLLQKVSYETLRDFNPIVLVGQSPNVLVVHPSLPVKTVKELIDLAKAKPGELNYASSGAGGSAHLAGALFESMAGVKFVRIPHKGAGDALNAVLAGQGEPIGFITVPTVTPHINAGKLRALGVTSAQPFATLPGVPTVASTVPGYESGGQTALFAPPKTPVAIINRLNQEVVRYVRKPEITEQFLKVGIAVDAGSPEDLRNFMKNDIAKWTKVIKDAGIKLE